MYLFYFVFFLGAKKKLNLMVIFNFLVKEMDLVDRNFGEPKVKN